MARTRLGVGGPMSAYAGFAPKSSTAFVPVGKFSEDAFVGVSAGDDEIVGMTTSVTDVMSGTTASSDQMRPA